MTKRYWGIRGLLGVSGEHGPQGHCVLETGFEPLGYGQLLGQITEGGRALRSWRIMQRDRVVFILPNGLWFAIVFLGVAAHAECAPLAPAQTRDQFAFLLIGLAAKAIVVPAGSDSARLSDGREKVLPTSS